MLIVRPVSTFPVSETSGAYHVSKFDARALEAEAYQNKNHPVCPVVKHGITSVHLLKEYPVSRDRTSPPISMSKLT